MNQIQLILQLLLNITHPLSTLKSICFITCGILLMSQTRGTCITFLTKSNLLLFQCLLTGANCCTENGHNVLSYWSSRFQGSMGPESLGWCYLVLNSIVHWFQYAAWILTCFMWERCGKTCPRFVLHPFFPAFSRTQLHQFLTLSPSSVQCLCVSSPAATVQTGSTSLACCYWNGHTQRLLPLSNCINYR